LCNIAVLNIGKENVGEFYDGVADITIKNRKFALKKLAKKGKYENIIVNHRQKDMKIFENRLKKYCTLSYETVLPLTETIVRLTAAKHGIKFPLSEIYIIASPAISREIILKLGNISRLYSVVSDEADRVITDELYYSYGYVIRNMKGFENKISDDSIIIRAGKKLPPPLLCVPVINLERESLSGKNIVNAGEIAVTDKKTEHIARLWGGICGLMIYEIMGMLPDENSQTDINKAADEIFLLDREAF